MPKEQKTESLEYFLIRTELKPIIKLNIKRLRRMRDRVKKENDDYYDFQFEIEAWESLMKHLKI